MEEKLSTLAYELMYNGFIYEVAVVLIAILILTFICRKKEWKKIWKILGISFFIFTGIYYFYYFILYHLIPNATKWIINISILKDSIYWNLCALLNVLLWRLIIGFFYNTVPNRIARYILFILIFLPYMYLFLLIWVFELRFIGKFLSIVFDLIPDIYI